MVHFAVCHVLRGILVLTFYTKLALITRAYGA